MQETPNLHVCLNLAIKGQQGQPEVVSTHRKLRDGLARRSRQRSRRLQLLDSREKGVLPAATAIATTTPIATAATEGLQQARGVQW